MSRNIILIHSSLIIRKGLVALLRNYIDGEIYTFENVPEPGFFHNKSLDAFFVEDKFLHPDYLKQVSKHRKGENVIAITMSRNEQAEGIKAEHFLPVNAEESEIADLLSQVFGFKKTETEEHEGEDLTIREKEVLKMVALGFSNKIIADKLFISIHTVISHRKNITEKLGIKSISGLTVYAMINRILDPDEIDARNIG